MKVFVSFSTEDTEVGREIVGECHRSGIEADSYDLRLRSSGKADLTRFLRDEMRKFDLAIVVWSNSYKEDDWLQRELFAMQAVELDRSLGPFIFLVLADGTPPPATLEHASAVSVGGRLTEGIAELIEKLPIVTQLFVIMKFGDEQLDSTYVTIIKPTAKEFGYEAVRIDEIEDSESINEQILRYIEGAGIVLCDLTGERPNVYFEAGYAMALRKEVILTAQQNANIHFDLNARRTIFWTSPRDLSDKLRARLQGIQDRLGRPA